MHAFSIQLRPTTFRRVAILDTRLARKVRHGQAAERQTAGLVPTPTLSFRFLAKGFCLQGFNDNCRRHLERGAMSRMINDRFAAEVGTPLIAHK